MRGKGKTVVVGMKGMEGGSMDVLTWALVKVASPGDLVVVLHVLPYSSSVGAGRTFPEPCSSLLSTINAFESMLAAYEGFCNLKQIDLKLKICRGSSLRRVLVREVRILAAASLVLGATNNTGFLGSWSSIARRCARRLPRDCSIMAVKNGKIIFRRESSPLYAEHSARSDSISESSSACSSFGRSRRFSSQFLAMISEDNYKKEEAEIYRETLKNLPSELQPIISRCSSTCRLFSYQELLDATSNFSPGMIIGKGGSSRVYRGILPLGKELAVKLLDKSDHVLHDFSSEIDILASLRHKNIVSLLGLCVENDNHALIYDYYSKGSVEKNLHGHVSTVDWSTRFDIAVGVAEALDYLHDQCVIHGDVKSSNVLLSDDLRARLSDFGLARRSCSALSRVSEIDIAGTFGYLAPEYLMYGKLSEEVDVYAFGVLILELLTGKKPINTDNPCRPESLVLWAKRMMRRGELAEIIDPCLEDKYDQDQAKRMALAADLCIKRAPKSRPRMNSILKLLRGEEEIEMESNIHDEITDQAANIQSYLSLALTDVEDDCFSVSSSDHTSDFIMSHRSLDEYLRGRWSAHSSFSSASYA